MPSLTKGNIAIAVMIILHLVGIIGIASSCREWILPLTPLTLLISGWLVIRSSERPKSSILFYVFMLAWGVECLGVHTGFPFGIYRYGSGLGPQVFDVPVMIGLLWLLLLMGCSRIARDFTTNRWLVALISAVLMTLLDVLIEPVAIDLNYWAWNQSQVPWSNYISWFVIAYVLSLIGSLDERFGNNFAALVFFYVQFVFFLILGILIA